MHMLMQLSGSCLIQPTRRNLFSRAFSQTFRSLKRPDPNSRDRWNYNESSLFDPDDGSALPYHTFRRVTATQLAKSNKEPPRRVRMLSRDFIDDALYNPHYGYFPKQATIFTPETPFDFALIPNSRVFHKEVAEKYRTYRVEAGLGSGPGRQVWHTPTELFKVPYSHNCIINSHLTSMSAVLRPRNSPMSHFRISFKVLSIRRYDNIRNRCRERYFGRKYSRFSAIRTPRGVRTNQISDH